MKAPLKYLEELRGEMSLYPTWFPGEPVELGAFGTIRDGQFVADGRLGDLGIVVEPTAPDGPRLDVKHQRGLKVQLATSASAKAGLVDAEAGVDFEVTRAYAWAFVARGMTKVGIRNVLEVGRAVLEAQRAGDWQSEWLVVSELRKVDHLNVMVARSTEAKGRLHGKGTVADWLDVLLQGEARFEISADDIFTVPNVKGATPLYGLRKLKGIWNPKLAPIGATPRGVDEPEPELAVANDEPFFR